MSEAATTTPTDTPATKESSTPPPETTAKPGNTSPESAKKGKPAEPTAPTTGPLNDDERTELDRLRGVHKDEQKYRREATENHRDAEAYRKLLAGLGVDGKDKKDFDPQAAIADLQSQFESEREARIRAEVARTEDVDPDVLQGKTEDEMRASAQRFKALVEAAVEKKAKGVAPAAAPAGEVTSNQKVDGPKQIASRDQLKNMSRADIIEAHRNGRLDDQVRGAST